MSLLALLIGFATATAYEGPKPEEVKQFRDWVVACDNQRYCEAVGLDPLGKHPMEITITRSLDEDGTTLTVESPETTPHFQLYLDGVDVPDGATQNGRLFYSGDDAVSLIRSLADGYSLTGKNIKGQTISGASLFGLTAALLYMDDRQERAGTQGAILKTGPKKVPEILPGWSVTLPISRDGRNTPIDVPEKTMKALSDSRKCDSPESSIAADDITISRLDGENTLLVLPETCLSGAYNQAARAFIMNNEGDYRPAKFDIDPGMSGDDASNWVANIFWEEQSGTLETSVLTRSVGDCGRYRAFIWDGEQFRMFRQQDMPVCGGRTRFVRTFTALYY